MTRTAIVFGPLLLLLFAAPLLLILLPLVFAVLPFLLVAFLGGASSHRMGSRRIEAWRPTLARVA